MLQTDRNKLREIAVKFAGFKASILANDLSLDQLGVAREYLHLAAKFFHEVSPTPSVLELHSLANELEYEINCKLRELTIQGKDTKKQSKVWRRGKI
jgi:hypothetical protein